MDRPRGLCIDADNAARCTWNVAELVGTLLDVVGFDGAEEGAHEGKGGVEGGCEDVEDDAEDGAEGAEGPMEAVVEGVDADAVVELGIVGKKSCSVARLAGIMRGRDDVGTLGSASLTILQLKSSSSAVSGGI